MGLLQEQNMLYFMIGGFAIVLIVLIALIAAIRNYGSAIQEISKKMNGEPKANAPVKAPSVQNGIPEEVVAAIAAAVYTLYGSTGHTITSIKRAERPARSAWATAGLLENTRPF